MVDLGLVYWYWPVVWYALLNFDLFGLQQGRTVAAFLLLEVTWLPIMILSWMVSGQGYCGAHLLSVKRVV